MTLGLATKGVLSGGSGGSVVKVQSLIGTLRQARLFGTIRAATLTGTIGGTP